MKLRVAAFIFGLIGWFFLFVSIFGSHFEQQLLELEKFTVSTTSTIVIKLVIFSAIVSIVKFQNSIMEKLEERQKLFSFLRKAYATAVFGCIFWIIILLV